MTLHLFRELDVLKRLLLEMGAMVEKSMALAVRAHEARDTVLARQVIDGDDAVDAQEVRVEEEALKLLALYQPVAADLRWIVAAIKINSDLERIGDLAVNIAQRVERLPVEAPAHTRVDVADMEARVMTMLRNSLDALVNLSAKQAADVCHADDAVDRLNRANSERVRAALVAHPEDVNYLLQVLAVSRNLERTADHATNIAQDVIYLIDGHIVRHRPLPPELGAEGGPRA